MAFEEFNDEWRRGTELDFRGKKLLIKPLPDPYSADGLDAVLWDTLHVLAMRHDDFRTMHWKRHARRLAIAAIIRADPAETRETICDPEDGLLPLDMQPIEEALLKGRGPVIASGLERMRVRMSAKACSRWRDLQTWGCHV